LLEWYIHSCDRRRLIRRKENAKKESKERKEKKPKVLRGKKKRINKEE
jgi:hypothetical protein